MKISRGAYRPLRPGEGRASPEELTPRREWIIAYEEIYEIKGTTGKNHYFSHSIRRDFICKQFHTRAGEDPGSAQKGMKKLVLFIPFPARASFR